MLKTILGIAISKNLAMHPKATAPYNAPVTGRNVDANFVIHKIERRSGGPLCTLAC